MLIGIVICEMTHRLGTTMSSGTRSPSTSALPASRRRRTSTAGYVNGRPLSNPLIRIFVRTTGVGRWCAFRFAKASAAIQHTVEVYHPSCGACINKLLPPDRQLPADNDRRSHIHPPFLSEPLIRSPQNFPPSYRPHSTIGERESQHILKNDLITVYPFALRANG